MNDGGPNDARKLEAGTAPAPPGHEPETRPRPPTSLTGFFEERPGVKPAAFIKALAERRVTTFDPADESTALEILRARGDGIRRLGELMQAALRSQHSRHMGAAARAVIAVSGRAARRVLDEAGLPASDTELSVEKFAQACIDGLAGREKGEKAEIQFALFKLALWLMTARRGLRGRAIVDLTRRYLLASGRKPKTSDLALLAQLAGPGTRPEAVQKNLGLIEPYILGYEEAQRQAQAHAQALEASKTRAGSLEEELHAERRVSDELRSHCSALEREIAQLRQDAADRQAAHAHQTRNLRGSFEKFVERDIRVRVRDAVAAAKLEPPHLDVVRERLDTVLELIDRELASERRPSEHADSRA